MHPAIEHKELVKKKPCFLILLLGMACLTFTACDNDDDEPMMTENTLYQKLGGTTMVWTW